MAKKKISSESLDFELALKELESIVERMEKGEQTLEESLSDFERGMKLSRQCQNNLKQAEQRVEKMLNNQEQENDSSVTTEAD